MSWKKFLLLLLCVNVIIAAWLPLHGDIHYFSDNARDMLLLHEIVHEKPITLIGPRSGISGVFHGPLWLYMNLPVYYLSGGNPAMVGWFWFGLFILNVGVMYAVGKRMFGEIAGLVAALLFSVAFYSTGWSQFNANGVLLVMPCIMLAVMEYIRLHEARWALITFFLIGLLIQFQIAFGLPMMILLALLLVTQVFKTKRWMHILTPFIVLLPVSTHILFDVRHDFIQLKSLIGYGAKEGGPLLSTLLQDRLWLALRELTNWIPGYGWALSVVLLVVLIVGCVKTHRAHLKLVGKLYAYLYIGFWLITLGYKGTMWPYYYWGLVPVLFLVLGGLIGSLQKNAQKWLLAACALFVILFQSHWFVYEREHVLAPRPISWKFHNDVVEKIYEKAPTEFGYYVFSDDLYGYQTKYAFVYQDDLFEGKRALLNTKKNATYTYMMPTASTDLTWDGWLKHQVRIDRAPDSVHDYPNGVSVYRYDLTPEEQAVPSDPYLLDSLMFR
jgi:hypothetical protein